jgi:hypothetical protein
MVVQRKMMITESERNRIRSLYSPKKPKDFVFDFVLTENEKYVIIMDQVFVAGGNGNSIGSIWEHTHIFNEIINESISKVESLTEEVRTNINNVVETIEWKKELVLEWIKEKDIISEGKTWDSIKSGISNVASKIGNAGVEAAKAIFFKGLLPALRWVRRGLYTGVGIVIDVVVSILAAKTNAIVWFVIVLLDIYEIGTGDYDPQDPDRMQMPFFFLFADLLGCIFTGAAALAMKKSAGAVAKGGLSKAGPTAVKMAEGAVQKIPGVKSSLKSVAQTLSQKIGPTAGGIIGKILGFIDNVLTKCLEFLKRLLSKEGLKATATGGMVYGTGKVVEKGLTTLDKDNKVGTAIAKFDQKIKDKTGLGIPKFSDNERNVALSYVRVQ